MKRLIFLVIIVIISQFSWAGKGEINFVETTVDLQKDGKALVVYTVQWKVISGEMHGFYFSGNDKLTPDFLHDSCYAVDTYGEKYGLDIQKVGADKWDIILAEGKGISWGSITYVFAFVADFHKAGYVDKTIRSDSTKLVVFNWSPVQWDEASSQDHYTLQLVLPGQVPDTDSLRNYVYENQLVLTEKFVNQKFKIDY
ncbi:MAG: hypothetical protein C0594_07840, partial [Marinilabiliales bacterium]